MRVRFPETRAVHISEALDTFVVQLRADGRVGSTIDQYRRHVGLLARWLAETGGPTEVERIQHQDLARFLSSPVVQCRHDGQPRKATSANGLRTSLRCFFAFVFDAGFTERNAGRLVRRAKCGTPPPRALPPGDCKRLLSALAKRQDPKGRRDHALVSLLVGAGLRIGSAVALRVEDLDLRQGIARLRCMKADRPAQAILAPGVVTVLRAYLGRRREGPVFESRPGKAIDVRQARRRLEQALEAAGAKQRCTPHGLRHAFAVALLAKTGNLRLVQRALGHSSVASTTVYAALDDQAVRRALSA